MVRSHGRKASTATLSFAVAAVLASSLASAQDAASGSEASAMLGEIVVTARKTAERLQDIPLSITAFGDEQIEKQGINGLDDVARLTPGVTFDLGGFPNDTRPAMRGMQAERGRPSVAVLLDGQDLGGENLSIAGGGSALNVRLLDLERIEVVKGPQSVLYGRNAFAGAVNYVSKRPSFTREARVAVEAGKAGLYDVIGSFTGPLIDDKLAFRANIARHKLDGYYTNGPTGTNVGGEDSLGGALSLLWKVNDQLSVVGRYQYVDEEYSDLPVVLVGANTRLPVFGGTWFAGPPIPANSRPCTNAEFSNPASPGFASCTRGTYVGKFDIQESQLDQSLNPLTGEAHKGMDLEQQTFSLDVDYEMGGGTWTYQFGWLDNTTDIQEDGDWTNFPVTSPASFALSSLQRLFYDTRHTNHEFRYQRTGEKLTWLGGAQYFKETAELHNASQFWLRNPNSVLRFPSAQPCAAAQACFPYGIATAPTLANESNYQVPIMRQTEYIGVFAALGYNFTEKLKLSLEARWNSDEIDYTIGGWSRQDITLFRKTPTCPAVPIASVDPNGPFAPPPPVPLLGPSSCGQTKTIDDSVVTPRATIEYRFTPDVLAYVTYAEGFKPGGFNTNEITDLAEQGYRSESVESYEAGLKTSWLDRSLTLNTAVYYNDYTDQQIGVQITNALGILVPGITNAASVEIKGIDVELAYAPNPNWLMSLAYAYTDATYGRYIQRSGNTVPSATNIAESGNADGDFSGNNVGKSPEHSLNAAVEWRRPMTETVGLSVGVDAQYRSKRYTDESNLAYLDAYTLVNARVGLDADNWGLMLYVDNLLDQDEVTTAQRNIDFGRPEGFAPGRAFQAYLPKPTTWGIRAEYRF